MHAHEAFQRWPPSDMTCLKETLIKNGQKGRKWVELVSETTPAYGNGGDSSGNPPVTQVTTPLIM